MEWDIFTDEISQRYTCAVSGLDEKAVATGRRGLPIMGRAHAAREKVNKFVPI
jgi:hypothetical protein